MLTKASIILALGCLSVMKAQTPFCSGGLCFIRPLPNSGNTWMDAQRKCRDNNSTLPIVDNPDHQRSFVDALSNFQLNGMDVWLGANASDNGSGNWRWLDGSQYTGSDVQQRGEYNKSYAFVASSSVTTALAYASPPNNNHSYICQYNLTVPSVCTNSTGRTAFVKENRCYVKYDEKLSWFSARNNCLTNSGDLASFSQLSLLDGIIDPSGYWVGLRHSQWNWQNAMTGSSTDVTFTSWRIGQPNGAAPQCIATDQGDFPNWKDIDCISGYMYICQVFNTTNPPSTQGATSSTTSSLSFPTPTSVTLSTSTSTTTSTFTTTGALGSTGIRTNTSTSSPRSSSSENDYSLAVGVGIGIPCAVIIIALVIVVTVQQTENRKLRRYIVKYKSEGSDFRESKEEFKSSQATVLQTVGNDVEENAHYQQLQTQNRMQDQQQYDQLSHAQYEPL